MKKNVVKLNESQLKKIVAESVKKVLKEGNEAESELFTKICELDGLLNTTPYYDALELEDSHLRAIYTELHPLLPKELRALKPYLKH